ncbi:hypothetical protein [Mycobacterium sp.]|uniref:DUF7882 family protein n=1 Tax=Mycobacterium sp. TaxID=1785 RepID=UPI0031D7A0E7
MAKLLQGGQSILTMGGGGANFLFAHLQTAAYERFREGQGFFITFFGGTDNNGEPMPANSIWCPAEVPLHFFFDEYEEPVKLQQELVDTILKTMNDPIGVIISPHNEFVWPFTPLKTERPQPPEPQS